MVLRSDTTQRNLLDILQMWHSANQKHCRMFDQMYSISSPIHLLKDAGSAKATKSEEYNLNIATNSISSTNMSKH